jgi:pentapeptide MXKDX repeat protein
MRVNGEDMFPLNGRHASEFPRKSLLGVSVLIQSPVQEELMKKRTLILSVLATSLMLAGPSFAADKMKSTMMKDEMKKPDTMMKDGAMTGDMKKPDAMMKDGAMKDGGMKDGAMKDAAMKGDMKMDHPKKDAMMKDDMKKPDTMMKKP